MQTSTLDGGFSRPSFDAARAFRAAMNAMARPGRIEPLSGARPPAPLSVAAGSLILTLCDPETPVHLAPGHDTPGVREWIAFHSGAPVVSRADADFAIGTWDMLLPLEDYRLGRSDYPERSATLIVERETLANEGPELRGPGIEDVSFFDLPETEAFRANAALFPLGLDFFFTAGDRVAALPRTTKVSA